MTAQELKFRCHALGDLMTEAKGKSKREKYNDALIARTKYQNDYDLCKDKETKTAKNKLAQLEKTNALIKELEASKDDVELSETCKKQILRTYASQVYGRRDEVSSKFLQKGHAREEDAITLVSRATKTFFKKNSERIENDFVSGEPDLFVGESIRKAKETLDTKCSWSLITFLNAVMDDELNTDYEWQGHGYMDLTGAEQHTVAYCLVNGTFKAIDSEIVRAARDLEVLDVSILPEDHPFRVKARQIERNHIFDLNAFMRENPYYQIENPHHYDSSTGTYTWDFDIPMERRLFTYTFKRSDTEIERLHKRVQDSRAWAAKNLFDNMKFSRCV